MPIGKLAVTFPSKWIRETHDTHRSGHGLGSLHNLLCLSRPVGLSDTRRSTALQLAMWRRSSRVIREPRRPGSDDRAVGPGGYKYMMRCMVAVLWSYIYIRWGR